MAKIEVNRLTNANVYVDGNSFLGRAEEIDLPKITQKMADHIALGMQGSIELPTGIEKMEARIKWNAMYADALKKMANPYQAMRLMLRASLEVYSAQGRVEEQPVVVYMTATAKETPLGNFKQHENVELENMLNVTYVKLEINGEPIVEFDALANVYKAGGVDLLATYRNNIGS